MKPVPTLRLMRAMSMGALTPEEVADIQSAFEYAPKIHTILGLSMLANAFLGIMAAAALGWLSP